MKKAFTLAEVLITLAIIGIVAALTIPTLVSKNEKKQLYTQFVKTYNTISNGFNMAIAENGSPAGWVFDENNQSDFLNKYIAPYLKIAKVCTNYNECFPEVYNSLNGDYVIGADDFLDSEFIYITLADGSSFIIRAFYDSFGRDLEYYTNVVSFGMYFDINGKKGPNVLGRDFHIIEYSAIDNTYSLILPYEESSDENLCDPSNNIEFNGYTCGSKMLREGAMNY